MWIDQVSQKFSIKEHIKGVSYKIFSVTPENTIKRGGMKKPIYNKQKSEVKSFFLTFSTNWHLSWFIL